MADNKKKDDSKKRISQSERLHFIGFDVFPGEAKDLFKSDSEKKKFVDHVLEKRGKGDVIRDDCMLMEERVSVLDRAVLAVASFVVIAALFLPWYSAYNETVEEAQVTVAPTETLATDSLVTDSAGLAEMIDSTAALALVEGTDGNPTGGAAEVAAGEETADEGEVDAAYGETVAEGAGSREELITSYVAKKKIHREYSKLSGIGSFLALGSAGSYVFSSGFALMLTAILFLVYGILCIGLPAYTLYGLFGFKGSEDQKALALKKVLRYNWIPVLLFTAALFLSFLGGDYGFDAPSLFTSIGASYGPGAFLGTLSWGVFVSMAAFVLVAVKGIEI